MQTSMQCARTVQLGGQWHPGLTQTPTWHPQLESILCAGAGAVLLVHHRVALVCDYVHGAPVAIQG